MLNGHRKIMIDNFSLIFFCTFRFYQLQQKNYKCQCLHGVYLMKMELKFFIVETSDVTLNITCHLVKTLKSLWKRRHTVSIVILMETCIFVIIFSWPLVSPYKLYDLILRFAQSFSIDFDVDIKTVLQAYLRYLSIHST
jgi:hypothetical protein